MKFHHLARHNQFTAAAAVAAAAAAAANHHQRDSSPGPQANANKLHLQQQQATSVQQQQISANSNMTDDEDEDFNEEAAAGFYPDQGQLQQQQQQVGHNQTPAGQLDSSGFLIDKNKKLFPQKLWELIHNPSIQHCLRWSQDGQRVYLNRNEFEAYYLKTPNNQFHTQKAISFVRQMNMYGFRKVDDCYYENDNFRRDRQHLLRNMIRRHPNKGLFVGLDHHQLAAAAAAQQALQVNQQLQQLEHQHKHRTEQALRLNSYLNGHHQHQHAAFHATSPFSAAHQHQLHGHHHHHQHHSSPFEHMSSQLAQVAANHLSQQQHQQLQHHLQQQQQLQNSTSAAAAAAAAAAALGPNHQQSLINNSFSNNLNNQAPSSVPVGQQHQHKKSRLLSNFYASTLSSNSNNNNNNNNNGSGKANYAAESQAANQMMHNQDSMHSTSSVDTQPSQCSSVVNSGSAGSPQPNSPTVIQQRLAALTGGNRQNGSSNPTSAALRAAVLAASQDPSLQSVVNKFALGAGGQTGSGLQQSAATDLSSQSLANRQALHQSLVRSLLQLKQNQQQQQQHPQDLLSSLQQHHHQQQNPRLLLESLASLSSVGSSGSIVDPTSNSPTERTATPPSSPPSPSLINREAKAAYGDYDNMALDLAKSSSPNHQHGLKCNLKLNGADEENSDEAEPLSDYPVDIEESEETEVEEDDDDDDEVNCRGRRNREKRVAADTVDAMASSPLEGAKKVRRFLDNQMQSNELGQQSAEMMVKIKRESSDSPQLHDYELPQKKRIKLSGCSLDGDDLSVSSISKSLIAEICDRRGDQLEVTALQEAARYTECFLEILLEDAALIARHSSNESEIDDHDHDDIKNSDSESEGKMRKGNVVDTSSLSLALKLIPSKLLSTIQQQVSFKAQA